MGENQRYLFEFGEFRLDPAERRLLQSGKVMPLTPKAFETLCILVENNGHIVEKTRLMELLWADTFVEEGNLADNVSKIRQALGDSAKSPKFIETVSGRGYRFVGEVHRVEAVGPPDKPTGSVPPADDRSNASLDSATPQLSRRPRLWTLVVFVLLTLAAAGSLLIWLQNRRAAEAPIKSVAILPFKPLVAGDRDEALELGISDSLISGLSRLGQIAVRPISAVRRYTDLDQDAAAAGRELRVESVLDGSIQRKGERIRISARLIRTADGATLWTETFDEKFTDIFSVQDSIAQRIIGAMALQLSGEDRDKLVRKYTSNTEAYQLYLKGRFFWSKLTPEGLQKSLDLYSQAIEIDPTYALAYAGQADSYNLLGSYGFWPMKASHPKAKAAAEKALAIDSDLAEAHASLAAVIADYYWDWDLADRHFKRALYLNPNYPVALTWYSQHLARLGRLEESVEEARRAQTLDPLSSSANAHVGLALYRARRYDDSIAELQKALEFDPKAVDAHIFLGFVYVQQGKSAEAIDEFKAVAELSERSPSLVALLGYAYAAAGKGDDARSILSEVDRRSTDGQRFPIERALIHIGLNEHDMAFEWLEKAFEDRAWQLGFLKVEPLFDPIRKDDRFSGLIRRLNL